MRYYFQRPPKNKNYKIDFKEDTQKQSITFFLYEQKSEEEDKKLLDQRTFRIAEIFVENFYSLLPIRDGKILEPVNMDQYRGQVGATENLQKVNQFDEYLCYLIFGDEPSLTKLSIIGLCEFETKYLKIENQEKYMDFYQIVEKSVDNPEKIYIDEEKRKILMTMAPNESLSGLEAQIDLLSQIVVSLVAELKPEVPEIYKKICNETPIEEFEDVLAKVSTGTLKNAKELLAEMEKQKGKIRENQKRYFEQRQQVRADLSECGN